MRLARSLYEQFRQLIHELAKFGVVGAIAFVVTTVGTNLLHFQAGMGPLTANAVATIVATCVSYTGNRWWTFRHREGSGIGREYLVFFLLNGIGLVIQLAVIGAAYYALGLTGKLSYNIALIFGIGLGTLFRFWSYRRWVWRLTPPQAEAPLRPAGPPAATGNGVTIGPPANGAAAGTAAPGNGTPVGQQPANGHPVRSPAPPTATARRDGSNGAG